MLPHKCFIEFVKISYSTTYNRIKFQRSDVRINRDEAREIATYNRDNKLEMERPKANVTMHGLRHSYANNLYKGILQDKLKEHSKIGERERTREIEKETRLEVSNMLGHGRDQITITYINN